MLTQPYKNIRLVLFLFLLPMIGRAQAPTFTSFGSGSTAMNSSLVITGTNLTGTTSLMFGATPARFTVNSNTQITATVPKAANSGPLRITKATGSALSSSIPVTRQSSSNVFSSVTTAFNAINVGFYSAPTFTDLDGDGLLDMLVGEYDGNLNHYEQNAANSTSFTLRTASFNSIDVGLKSKPSFTDLDGDGLLDMLVGEEDGNLNHYEQNATNSTSFTLRTTNFNGIDVGFESTPTLTDLDGDGLLDMIVGEIFGNLNHYEQNTANSTSFTLITENFSGIDVGAESAPTLTDLDGDGLLDLIVGEYYGDLKHFEQNAANSTSFTLITANFNGINDGIASPSNRAPTFTDLDGDGLLDLIIGEYYGNINHYEQNQSPIISTLSANPACYGATVSITGTALTGATLVTINGTSVGTLSGVTATNITFTVPANATSGNIVVTTPNGTSNAVAMTINALPTTPTIAGATAICTGGNTTLTTTYSLGTNEQYLWSNNSSLSTLTVNAAGTYSLRIRNTATGCTSTISNAITIIVNPLPTTPTITGATAVCAGNSTSLTTTRTLLANEAYLWSSGDTTQNITISTAGPYSLRIRNRVTGCTSAVSNTITVTVNPLPTTPVIAGATAICTGSNTTLTTTRTLLANEAYLWSNNSTLSTLSVNAAGTYSLRIRNTATGCTSAISNAITIIVNPLPTTQSITPTTPAATCGTAITLTASTSAGNTYQWKLNGTNISGATSVTYDAATTGNYTVVAVTPEGCTSPAVSNTVAVTVNTVPTVSNFGSASTAMNSSLVITGTNLTGTTSVRFGETPARFTVNSNTQITAIVPRVANTGKLSLTKSTGCQSLSSAIPVTRQSTSNVFGSVTTAFNGIAVGFYSATTLTDLDGDGLLDMLVGEQDGNLNHYEQNAANSTSFTFRTASFNGIDVGDYSKPTFTDIDGDGLLDMIVGEVFGTLNHYEQNTANSTSFTLRTANFNGIDVGFESKPTLTDLDGDGLLDLLVGEGDGNLNHYEQNTANSTSFTLITEGFNGIGVGGYSAPTFTDLDGDGFLDMLIGKTDGTISHYEQNAANSTSFTLTTENFSGIGVGYFSNPIITDLDGDGLLDLLVGEGDGNLNHYEQNQSPVISTLSANPACVGATVSITGTALTGATLVTINGTTLGTLSGVTATNITFTVPANVTSGNIVVTTPNGTSNAVAMTINALPTTPTIAGATAICTGGNTTLTTTYSLGTNEQYLWSNNSSLSTLTVNAAGTYSLRIRNTATGCTSTISNAITIIVNPLPTTQSITPTNPAAGCGALTLTASTSAGNTYQWKLNGTNIPGATSITYNATTSGNYTVVAVTPQGCSSATISNTVAVIVNPLPTTPIVTGTNYFCSGGSTVLTSTVTTGTYLWNTGATSQSITVTAIGDYNVRVITSGCTSAVSSNYTVTTLPTGTWLGTTSNWNTATNWCGGVPTASTDITLPITGLLPTITGTTATCRNLTIPVGVTLNIENGANFNLKGNLSGLGSIAGVSGSTLTLSGSTAQTIQRVNVGTLVVNNNAGITLGGNISLSTGVTLTNGILNTQTHNLILLNTATSPTETANSYVMGNIRSTARMIGTGTGSMFGITIAAGTDNLDTVMVERGENAANYNGNEGIGHIWKIRAGNQPVSGRQITLAWNPRADNGKDITRLQVYRRPDTGSEWIRMGGIVNGSSRSITLTTNSFSDWTISDQDAPLPVTLTSFTGKATQFGNQLNWTTSSEVNNQGFNVERSSDGRTFTKIGIVKGFGTTNSKQTYQFTDSQLSEAYYRLQQVDFDGKTEYSATIKVGENVFSNLLEIYPNPATDKVTIRTNGTGTIEIVNNLGQVLITQPAIGTNEFNVSKLAMGVYTVKFNGVSQKLVIR